MPKLITEKQLQAVIDAVAEFSDGAVVSEILDSMADAPPRRTLQRYLAILTERGMLIRKGAGRGCRYFVVVEGAKPGRCISLSRSSAAALGASILVLLVAGTFVYKHLPQSSIATVADISGDVYVRTRFKIKEARQGMEIASGAQVINKDGRSAAVVTTHDGSVLEVSGSAQTTFSFIGGQYRMNLPEGILVADVKTQPENRPLLIATPSAEVTVRGTTLNLHVAANVTKLRVEEGKVEIRKKSSRNKVLVNAGETAIAEKGRELRAGRDVSIDRFKGGWN